MGAVERWTRDLRASGPLEGEKLRKARLTFCASLVGSDEPALSLGETGTDTPTVTERGRRAAKGLAVPHP